MGWFRKIFHVAIVVGVAALMSIPFKRVPPQETSKSGYRGEWELDRPGLPFKLGDVLSSDGKPLESRKPVIPAEDLARPRASSDSTPSSTSSSPSYGSSSSGSPSSGTSSDRSMTERRGFEDSRASDDPVTAIRDHEGSRPMSTTPRIESQPARPERLNDTSPLPDLPSEFKSLGDP